MTSFTTDYVQCARDLLSLSPLYHVVQGHSYLEWMAKQKTPGSRRIRWMDITISHVYSQPRGGGSCRATRGCAEEQSEREVGAGFAVPVRQAGTWGPLPQCLHLDKCLLQQQNTKNL